MIGGHQPKGPSIDPVVVPPKDVQAPSTLRITPQEAGELYQLASIAGMKAEERAHAGENGKLDRDPERSREMGRMWQEAVGRAEKWKERLQAVAIEEE